MFKFVIKYFGFLKRAPLLPHLFDSQFKLWLLFTNAALLDCLSDIETEVLNWEQTTISMHKFGGIQFNCNGREIGHIHSNGILDILFSRKIKEQLMAEGRISDHHVFARSGWISFYITKKDDQAYAVRLLEMAYLKIKSEEPLLNAPHSSSAKEGTLPLASFITHSFGEGRVRPPAPLRRI